MALPGAAVRRTLVTPAPDRAVSTYAFDTVPARAGCVASAGGTRAAARPRCVRGAEEPLGLDRAFTVAVPASYDVEVTAVPRPGPALDALLAPAARRAAGVAATPGHGLVQRGARPARRPGRRGGRRPRHDVGGRPRRSRPRAHPGLGPAADRRPPAGRAPARHGGRHADRPSPSAAGGQQWTVGLEPDGTARFAPITTDRLTLRFPLAAPLTSFDPYTRGLDALGVGVAEVEVPGLGAPDPAAVVEVPCGGGPTVRVDGRAHRRPRCAPPWATCGRCGPCG